MFWLSRQGQASGDLRDVPSAFGAVQGASSDACASVVERQAWLHRNAFPNGNLENRVWPTEILGLTYLLRERLTDTTCTNGSLSSRL